MTRSHADDSQDNGLHHRSRSSAIHPRPPSWTDTAEPAIADRGNSRQRNGFAHIKDLQAQAQSIIAEYGAYMPVSKGRWVRKINLRYSEGADFAHRFANSWTMQRMLQGEL